MNEMTNQKVFNWNSTFAYKDDEDRLPEHDVVNMTFRLWDDILYNRIPESKDIWFLCVTTSTSQRTDSRMAMTNMRFLAEMYQGRYRFANVLQELWAGWNVIQMTDTFILPNCWTITPDDDGGHTMHEIIPMSLDITGFA